MTPTAGMLVFAAMTASAAIWGALAGLVGFARLSAALFFVGTLFWIGGAVSAVVATVDYFVGAHTND